MPKTGEMKPHEVSQDLHSLFDRNASFDNSPNRSTPGSPQKSTTKKSRSIHAQRAEEYRMRESLTPGTLAAQAKFSQNSPGTSLEAATHAGPSDFLQPLSHATWDNAPQRPARRRESSPLLPVTPRRAESRINLIVDEIPIVELQEMDELTMESLVLAQNQAVQHVVVAGCGRQYMACTCVCVFSCVRGRAASGGALAPEPPRARWIVLGPIFEEQKFSRVLKFSCVL